MAENDELDALLRSEQMKEEDWQFLFCFVDKGAREALKVGRWIEGMNEYIRHTCYGHTISNMFRTLYEPDYRIIVAATANKLKLPVHEHQSVVEIEHNILVELINRLKAQFIKEKGEEAWKAMEKEIEEEMRRSAAEGKFSADDTDWVRGAWPGGVMGLLTAGRLSGFGVYMLANKLFFAVSRRLALGIGVAVAGPIIGRTLAFILGPGGWLLTGIWLVYDLGNTNWKKTMAAVMGVALLRRQFDLGAGAGVPR